MTERIRRPFWYGTSPAETSHVSTTTTVRAKAEHVKLQTSPDFLGSRLVPKHVLRESIDSDSDLSDSDSVVIDTCSRFYYDGETPEYVEDTQASSQS